RIGFRRTLASAYLILTIGYFLLGSLSADFLAPLREAVPLYWFVLAILMVPALGPGVVKPVVAGTTARASTEQVRALGFSIYYTIVNIGGTLGPLMAFFVRRTLGLEYVFRVSALFTAAMFVVTILFFREPARSETSQPTTVGQAIRNLFVVFGNLKFIAFLLIFSGFYVVFWQQYVALPLFLRRLNPEANVDLLLMVDPATVILFTFLISYLTRGAPTFLALTVGVAISGLSWLLLMVSATTLFVIVALFVLALGEIVVSPRYYDYVSRLAPVGQQGLYMGFSFLPVAVGDLVGSPLGGWMVSHFGQDGRRLEHMWLVAAGVGLLTAALMFVYDRMVRR
ncbi:MAG TPA: MFS transporter, partial [Gemmatimonadales bacterium]|nr:MFS transporter [Gemmatimonadales bacterium]